MDFLYVNSSHCLFYHETTLNKPIYLRPIYTSAIRNYRSQCDRNFRAIVIFELPPAYRSCVQISELKNLSALIHKNLIRYDGECRWGCRVDDVLNGFENVKTKERREKSIFSVPSSHLSDANTPCVCFSVFLFIHWFNIRL